MAGESPWKKPKLVQQEKTCSKHEGSNIDMFCNTDQSWICFFCTTDDHKDHDAVAVVVKRKEQQNELEQEQKKYLQGIQRKRKEMEELKQNVNVIKQEAQTAIEKSEKIFNELIHHAKKKHLEVKTVIRDQEKAEVSRAEQDLKNIELEIADLKIKVSGLQQLSQTTDHIHFLQTFPSLCVFSGCKDLPRISPHLSLNRVNQMILYLTEELNKFCGVDLGQIPLEDLKICKPENRKSEEGTSHKQDLAELLHVEPVITNNTQAASLRTSPSELNSRGDFLEYFCYLTLDPNTAHRNLRLYGSSGMERKVMWTDRKQIYSVHPERFDSCEQVLCKEPLHGCCYWEVEWLAGISVAISVSYKGIGRKGEGDECRFGANHQSWSLVCTESAFYFWHNNVRTEINGPCGSRIGVYVNHSEGILSFYSNSNTIKCLHTVRTMFTEPLFAGFGVYQGSKIKLRNLELSVLGH